MVRVAKMGDEGAVISLLYEAMGEIAFTLSGVRDEAKTKQILAGFCLKGGNRLSFENILVFDGGAGFDGSNGFDGFSRVENDDFSDKNGDGGSFSRVGDSNILGAVCFYKSELAARFDEPFRARLKELKLTDNITPECPPEPQNIYIDSIAVSKNYRGRGIAKMLLNAVFERFSGHSFSLIAKSEAAISLYKKLGFSPAGPSNIPHYTLMKRPNNDY